MIEFYIQICRMVIAMLLVRTIDSKISKFLGKGSRTKSPGVVRHFLVAKTVVLAPGALNPEITALETLNPEALAQNLGLVQIQGGEDGWEEVGPVEEMGDDWEEVGPTETIQHDWQVYTSPEDKAINMMMESIIIPPDPEPAPEDISEINPTDLN